MSEPAHRPAHPPRVVFVPSGSRAPAGSTPIGRHATGAWVACDDDTALLAGGDRLELLWLSRAGYDRAIHRLDGKDVAEVIARRRTAFAAQLPARSTGELFEIRIRALTVAAGDPASTGFERSLGVLAQLAGPARFAGIKDAGLLDRLLEREEGLRNELASPEGAPEAAPGEIAMRARFVDTSVQLLARCGRPGYAEAPLYVPLVRGYLLVPPPGDLLAEWQRDGLDPVPWRGGVIGPLRPDEADELAPSLTTVKLVLPDGRHAAGMQRSLTAAQLVVALEDRERDLGMTPHVTGLRVELATFRRNAATMVRDPEFAAALAAQITEETVVLRAALAARPAFVDPVPPSAPATTEAGVLAEFTAAANLLAALIARCGVEWQGLAARLLALGHGT